MSTAALDSSARMASRKRKHVLEHFKEALRAHPEALKGMHPKTMERYMRDEMPAVFSWLVENPALLAALLRDSGRLEKPDNPAPEMATTPK